MSHSPSTPLQMSALNATVVRIQNQGTPAGKPWSLQQWYTSLQKKVEDQLVQPTAMEILGKEGLAWWTSPRVHEAQRTLPSAIDLHHTLAFLGWTEHTRLWHLKMDYYCVLSCICDHRMPARTHVHAQLWRVNSNWWNHRKGETKVKASKATDIQSVLAGLLRGGSVEPGSELSKTLKSGSVTFNCDVWCASTDISLWRASTPSFTILILSSLVASSHVKLSMVNGLNQLCCRPMSTCWPIDATQFLRDRTESLSVWSLSSSDIKWNLFSW